MVPLLELVRRLSVGIMASSSVMFSVFKDEEILRCVSFAIFVTSALAVGLTHRNLTLRCILHALAMICLPILVLVFGRSISLQAITECFPMLLALITAVALSDRRGNRTNAINNERTGEVIRRRLDTTRFELENRREPAPPDIPPLSSSYHELQFSHMEGGGVQTGNRTSTHTSSISLSQTALSQPRSSWEPSVRELFDRDRNPGWAIAEKNAPQS